jgi:hypothetical protein
MIKPAAWLFGGALVLWYLGSRPKAAGAVVTGLPPAGAPGGSSGGLPAYVGTFPGGAPTTGDGGLEPNPYGPGYLFDAPAAVHSDDADLYFVIGSETINPLEFVRLVFDTRPGKLKPMDRVVYERNLLAAVESGELPTGGASSSAVVGLVQAFDAIYEYSTSSGWFSQMALKVAAAYELAGPPWSLNVPTEAEMHAAVSGTAYGLGTLGGPWLA